MNESREQQLQGILHAYLHAIDRGEKPDRQVILKENPDLRNELAEYFADASKLAAMVKSLKTASFGGDEIVSPSLGRVRYFGDYELLEEIARGGMGVVFRAKQVSLNRAVALKMILKGEFASEADVRRFRQEAEAAANLDHPNIVPIYEVAEHEGQQYFSMKLVERGERKSGLRETAETLAKVARAVHHAHQRGILHRDLKPSNILVDKDGEPHVADFGLAKKVEGGEEATKSGAILGTPAYMAPEQARAEKGLTTAVDVYSLGAILYELLTGQPPFRGSTPLETVLQVVEREPVLPRQLNSRVPRDLETICLKCLQKEPGRRYPSAEALADDLQRWLDGEPIQARPSTTMERVVKWMRRNPALAAASTLAATLLLASVVLLIIHTQALSENADELRHREKVARNSEALAVASAREARDERARVQIQLYAARMDQARQAWETDQVGWLGELLDGQRPEKTGKVDLRGPEWHYWDRLSRVAWELAKDAKNAATWSYTGALAYDPAGRRLARIRGTQVVLHDAGTGAELQAFECGEGYYSAHGLAFSPDGKELLASGKREAQASSGEQGLQVWVRIWDLGTGRCRETLTIGPSVGRALAQIARSPVGAWLATVVGNEVVVWDLELKKEITRIKGDGLVQALAFAPDDKRLAVCWRGGDVHVYDRATGQTVLRYEGNLGPVPAIAFSPDGRWLAGGRWAQNRDLMQPKESPDAWKAIVLWDAQTGKVRQSWHGENAPQVEALAFSPDSRMLASGENLGRIILWDVATGVAVQEWRTRERMRTVAFRSDGRHLAAATYEGAVRVWDRATNPRRRTLFHGEAVSCVAFSPDGKYLATRPDGRYEVLGDGLPPLHTRELERANYRMVLWDRHSGAKVREFPQAGEVNCLVFSPNSRWLASSSLQVRPNKGLPGVVRTVLWDVASGKAVWSDEHFALSDNERGVAFSPDGKHMAYLEGDRVGGNDAIFGVQVRDIESSTVLWKRHVMLDGVGGTTLGLAFSPQGDEIAVATSLGALVMDARTGDRIYERRALKPVQAVAFRPLGGELAIADGEQIELVDYRAKQTLSILKGHGRQVEALSYSPDGKRLASVASDGSVRLWDRATARTVLLLPGQACVAFSPDGTELAAAGANLGTLVLWNLGPR